ncbi:hypothetical protein [Longimicrobium sp.]|jgi:hypothetical protein|uniref:hypothetical protein n=1 Tax=Longimicrobium sp. TaxID=2029185 RepID=UPI002ED9C097
MSHGAHKEPLYRKVNTQTHRVHHDVGGNFRTERQAAGESDASRGAMHGKSRRGLDYTPLFRFLLSRVGSEWNSVYSEAIARLDRPDPIFWLVALHEHERQEKVRVGESSYYSGLYIDAAGILQLVNPDLRPQDLVPYCTCCTHTLNAVRFGSRP